MLLDDFYIKPKSAADDLGQQMRLLSAKLESELQSLRQVTKTPIKVIWCEGRQPKGESDFSSKHMEELRFKRGVLEVWGSVTEQEALVSFLMIPVRPQERGTYGFHQVPYKIGKTSDPLDLFKQRSELPVLGLLSMALYDLTPRNAHRAFALLNQAEIWLRKDPNLAASLGGYIQKLRAEASQMACQSKKANLACSASTGGN